VKVHTIHEAKTNLSKLIQRAEEGEEIILARGREPVARIVPFAAPHKKRVLGGFEGKVWASEDAFAPLTDEELRDWGLE